jgi:outer membrane protein
MTLLTRVFLVALAFSLLAAAPPRPAAAQGAPIVAILDVPHIQRESKAAKSIQAEIEKKRAAFQAEIADQEKSLRAADQKLKSQQATLSREDYQKKRQEIEAQADKFRKNAQARRDQLEKAVNAGADQIRKALVQVVGEIAKAQGYTLVLNKTMVVWPGPTADITAETLKKLDQVLPKVTLPK